MGASVDIADMTVECTLHDEKSLDGPLAGVGIPYEGGELSGHLFLVDVSGTPRPTMIYSNGFAATRKDGYLVARYAAHDHLSAMIVCNDGMTTFYAFYPPIPESLLELIEDEHDDDATPMLDILEKKDTNARRAVQNGQWESGTVFAGQAANFVHAITAPVHHVVMRNADGAVH